MRFYKLFIISIFAINFLTAQQDLVQYVDPFIGTAGHAHTFPGATMPFGMVQLSPDTDTRGWDWCSGYHYSDNSLIGFSHTHLSGTGASDYGDILIMPTTGEIKSIAGSKDNPDEGFRSRFSHEQEKAEAGYYSVKLLDYDVDVELTVTERTGFHKYTFPSSTEANIIIDLQHGIFDVAGESEIEIVGNNIVQGFRRSHGWAADHKVFFYLELSKPFTEFGIIKDDIILADKRSGDGKNVKAYLQFGDKAVGTVLAKVGISAVSIEGAKKNLSEENADWDFEKIKKQASEKWNKALSKIIVENKNHDETVKFYTALYHSMIAPNLFSDVDGKYRGMDGEIYLSESSEMYTVFSLWDTYRATHPLFTIIEQDRTVDFINSLLYKYERYGLLPVWELAANETNCMIGYHSVPVIVDAFMKGINSFNTDKALEAMAASGSQDIRGTASYRQCGYIPSELDHEGVSRTLEYAYDDWCIAVMAKSLGDENIYEEYINRAGNYRNFYDASTGFMRPKQNGKWKEPFDPYAVTNDFTEANSWQYSFYVPQDVKGMIDMMGGNDKFVNNLEKLFTVSSELTGRHQSDITGLIGQYAHGNEPSHHAAYLFNYAAAPWKTQKFVRTICDSLYKTGPEGLSGNDDCGQLSSWFVFSALGFYPVCPGETYYVIGSPTIDEAAINLENGKSFIVRVKNNSNENVYIQNITLNGKPYTKSYIEHSHIMAGGEMVFTMGSEPNKNWGSREEDIPKSAIPKKSAVVPYMASGESLFKDETEVRLVSTEKDADIFYYLGEKQGSPEYIKYTRPFIINEPTQLHFKTVREGMLPSAEVATRFYKLNSDWKITLGTDYHPSYPGRGNQTLIDGIRGLPNYRTPAWQGYEGKDLEVIVDLGELKEINQVGIGMLQEAGVWIFLPEYVEFSFSENGAEFFGKQKIKNETPTKSSGKFIQDFIAETDSIKSRYIKVFVKGLINCPVWHGGAGLPCFFFTDEIFVN